MISCRYNIMSYLNPNGYQENYSACTIFNVGNEFVKLSDQLLYFTAICSLLPGGYLGVAWGLGGVNLSEPPGNSQ